MSIDRALIRSCHAEAAHLGVNPFALYFARVAGFQTVADHVAAKREAFAKQEQIRAERRRAERAERMAAAPARESFFSVDGAIYVRRVDGRVERMGEGRVLIEKRLVGMMVSDPDGELTMTVVQTAQGARYLVQYEEMTIVTSLRWEAVYVVDSVGSPVSAREFFGRYTTVESAAA